MLVTALREVTEETGCRPRIGPYLTTLRYNVRSRGHPSTKVVTYWSMRCAGGSFRANNEVDQMQWLPLDEARRRVTIAKGPHDSVGSGSSWGSGPYRVNASVPARAAFSVLAMAFHSAIRACCLGFLLLWRHAKPSSTNQMGAT